MSEKLIFCVILAPDLVILGKIFVEFLQWLN